MPLINLFQCHLTSGCLFLCRQPSAFQYVNIPICRQIFKNYIKKHRETHAWNLTHHLTQIEGSINNPWQFVRFLFQKVLTCLFITFPSFCWCVTIHNTHCILILQSIRTVLCFIVVWYDIDYITDIKQNIHYFKKSGM